MCSFFCRLPTPKRLPDLNTFAGYENQSGLTVDIMKDLQRICACLKVHNPADSTDVSLPELSKWDHEYLAKVAGISDFGARVTVPMSAQGSWRREGSQLGGLL